jgi:hypothetical protein
MPLVEKEAVLTLKDGTIIHPDGSRTRPGQEKRVEIPSNSRAQQIVARANRRLGDLPSLPAQLNAMSVVLVYTLWGLVDADIAIATGLTVQQVKAIRAHDVYHTLQKDMLEQIKKADEDTVRALINEHAERAVNKVVVLMDSEDEKISLGASKDILDRAGHRPADIVEHRHMLTDTLRIEVTTRNADEAEIPAIDITADSVEIK